MDLIRVSHLMLAFAHDCPAEPELQKHATEQLTTFLCDPQSRERKITPMRWTGSWRDVKARMPDNANQCHLGGDNLCSERDCTQLKVCCNMMVNPPLYQLKINDKNAGHCGGFLGDSTTKKSASTLSRPDFI
ncbi:hypothetical protein CYMTET_3705 [Cymbomonas tetramitiformis]|uniref:Uncharacterized protein n=1 Tax=Cymbomonas tetramitiformis TaxID=36881 RepID=A0AAE0H2J9_9CHLO|nr:hypothetical protein CYMTET_3705 [Cymbomonas tetramitiformis]